MSSSSVSPTVVLAGATGDLGTRIVRELRARGAQVRALVRRRDESSAALESQGAVAVVADLADLADRAALVRACTGASCVVSALAGLREVIVHAQTALVDAAVEAGVPRFIPSDYAIDFPRQPTGWNRNLDLRREFHSVLAGKAIAATSILNGAFMDLLTGPAPFILWPLRRVLYWENPDQPMDFTTRDDTAAFVARAALEASTPRFLRIAGDSPSARDLASLAGEIAGKPFRLLRAGGLDRLETIIRALRLVVPGRNRVYPPWQQMQYMHNMFAGRAKLEPLDNHRYPDLRFTRVREVLAAKHAPARAALQGA